MKLLMEELNNEVSNVEQQVSWTWNANDIFYHDTIQIALQGPLYNTPPNRAALGEPTFLNISLQNVANRLR